MDKFQYQMNAKRSDSGVFDASAVECDPLAFIVHARNYSRTLPDGTQESYDDTIKRVMEYITELGGLEENEMEEVRINMTKGVVFSSGRSMWSGGTGWSSNQDNFPGLYNCSSTEISDIDSIGMVMDLAMMGCGTGTVLEKTAVQRLPTVSRRVTLKTVVPVSTRERGHEDTLFDEVSPFSYRIRVGDSRAGWVDALLIVLRVAFGLIRTLPDCDISLEIDLSEVRHAGARLRGFGGVANPDRLGTFYANVISILNCAKGRKLDAKEVCRLLDEISLVVVAGNIRRTAGLRQFDFDDDSVSNLKKDLYQHDGDRLVIDEGRVGMQLSAHTRVIHRDPSLAEVVRSVRSQFESGEGALEYAPEAIARGSADLLHTQADKNEFMKRYMASASDADTFLIRSDVHDPVERYHRLHRYGLNPCGEIIGHEFICNLSEVHLNRLDPSDHAGQRSAFRSAGIIAATFLTQRFSNRRHQQSREFDPIVGVSFTGLWDFFVLAFGSKWIQWMMDGRPSNLSFERTEIRYLVAWREAAWAGVEEFCRSRGLKIPSRVTTVQPAGTKSMLTGASPGWHAPKSIHYIRRINFPAKDPLALACMECGYKVVPAVHGVCGHVPGIWSHGCKDWLVEVPCRVAWSELVHTADFRLDRLPAQSQFRLYMVVQKFYTDHNTSGTIEVSAHELNTLAASIYREIGHGYVSLSLTARLSDDVIYPQMPIQPVSAQQYARELAGVKARCRSCSLASSFRRFSSTPGLSHCLSYYNESCGCSD